MRLGGLAASRELVFLVCDRCSRFPRLKRSPEGVGARNCCSDYRAVGYNPSNMSVQTRRKYRKGVHTSTISNLLGMPTFGQDC